MWLSLVYDNHNVKTYEYRLIVNPENTSELVYSSAIWLMVGVKIFHSMTNAIEWAVQRAT